MGGAVEMADGFWVYELHDLDVIWKSTAFTGKFESWGQALDGRQRNPISK